MVCLSVYRLEIRKSQDLMPTVNYECVLLTLLFTFVEIKISSSRYEHNLFCTNLKHFRVRTKIQFILFRIPQNWLNDLNETGCSLCISLFVVGHTRNLLWTPLHFRPGPVKSKVNDDNMWKSLHKVSFWSFMRQPIFWNLALTLPLT